MSSKDLKQEEQAEKNQINHERSDLRKVLALPEGQRFIWRLFEIAGIYRNPYSGDTQSTEYNCGMMAVGQAVLDEAMEANPEAVSSLIIKNKTRK
tara:strand:- start:2899 stop:3183 length:285 start_codon:yes stop_codon:yes gene_type:complete